MINKNLNKGEVDMSILNEEFLKRILYEFKDAGHEGLRSSIENIVEDAVDRERKNGILNTAAALKDAKVNEEDTLTYLQKHWNMSRGKAGRYLKVDLPYRELEKYLYNQGFTNQDVRDFMISNMVMKKIIRNKILWKLTPEKIKKEVEEIK